MHHSVYTTTCHDIYWNLAAEAFLMENCTDRVILYLWRNEPTVVIGRYQNPFIECDLMRMKDYGIRLSRRFSGGGAVYHDMGNLCFTMICPESCYDVSANFAIVIEALRRCNVEATLSGRNDILVDGLKISGSAFQIKNKNACHHGTLLVDCDLSRLPDVLTPSRQKLESHGIRSVASRVSNLSAIRPDVNVGMIEDKLVEVFGADEMSVLDDVLLMNNSRIKEIHNQLSSDDWLYGNTPRFTDRISGRTSRGDVVIQLNVEKAVITDAVVFSDNLNNEDVELLMESLKGKRYDRDCLIAQSEKSTNVFVSEALAILSDSISG